MLIAIYFFLIGAIFYKMFIQLPRHENQKRVDLNLNNVEHTPVMLNKDKAAKNNA
jgi:hypothetical protein